MKRETAALAPDNAILEQGSVAGFRYLGASRTAVADHAAIIGSAELDGRLVRPADPSFNQIMSAETSEIGLKLQGEFAAMLVSPDQSQITLFRDLCGAVPLYFMKDRHDGWLVATHPLILAATRDYDINPDALRRKYHDYQFARDFLYEGVEQVRPGETVILSPDGVARTHAPLPTPSKIRSLAEWRRDYLHMLDQAVASALPADGPVAIHLSSGLDSSAVAARASHLIDDRERLFTITVAPAGDYGPFRRNRFADESDIAAMTAKSLGLRHFILRAEGPDLLSAMDRYVALTGEPCLSPLPARWWMASRDLARQMGARALLTGENGNVTLNWGGLPVLHDYRHQRSPFTFLKEALASKRKNDVRWRGLIAQFLPQIHSALMQIGGKDFSNAPPPSSPTQATGNAAWRQETIIEDDPAPSRLAADLGWSIRESDPTSDSRLVHWSLSLPPEAFLKDGIYRPMARTALADLLPDQVINPTRRGIQVTDWPFWFKQELARQLWEEARANDMAQSLLDFEAMDEAIRHWPKDNFNVGATFANYPMMLARALGVAHFCARYLPSKKAAIRSTS